MITRNVIAAELSSRLNVSKREAYDMANELFDIIVIHIKRGDEVRIPGLFSTVYKNNGPKMLRNPRNGTSVEIPARRSVRLKLAKMLRNI